MARGTFKMNRRPLFDRRRAQAEPEHCTVPFEFFVHHGDKATKVRFDGHRVVWIPNYAIQRHWKDPDTERRYMRIQRSIVEQKGLAALAFQEPFEAFDRRHPDIYEAFEVSALHRFTRRETFTPEGVLYDLRAFERPGFDRAFAWFYGQRWRRQYPDWAHACKEISE